MKPVTLLDNDKLNVELFQGDEGPMVIITNENEGIEASADLFWDMVSSAIRYLIENRELGK